jgi:hypothetical protein
MGASTSRNAASSSSVDPNISNSGSIARILNASGNTSDMSIIVGTPIICDGTTNGTPVVLPPTSSLPSPSTPTSPSHPPHQHHYHGDVDTKNSSSWVCTFWFYSCRDASTFGVVHPHGTGERLILCHGGNATGRSVSLPASPFHVKPLPQHLDATTLSSTSSATVTPSMPKHVIGQLAVWLDCSNHVTIGWFIDDCLISWYCSLFLFLDHFARIT